MDLVDPKELRDQLVPRGLRESPERLVLWDFMEKEVHLVCLVQRVIMGQLDAEEILDRLDLQENVVYKDNRVQLVWLDFQLRKEKEERVDLVEKQVQLEKKDPEESQESREHKVSKELKDQLVAQDPKEVMESQDLKEVLADQEPQEIREPKVELDQLESVDKKETVVIRVPLVLLDSLVLLADLDPKDQLDRLVFQELKVHKARKVSRELQEILVSQDVLGIPE